MQTINYQTVKIAQVLISNSMYFIKCYKFNCFSTSDISRFQNSTVLQLRPLLAVEFQLKYNWVYLGIIRPLLAVEFQLKYNWVYLGIS